MDQDKKRAAFTLIEFIIITGIVAIMSVVTLAQYGSTRSNGTLDSQASRLIDTLDLARKKAVSGDEFVATTTPSCPSGNTLVGYRVTFSGGSPNYNTYTLQRICKDVSTSIENSQDLSSYSPSSDGLGNVVFNTGSSTITFLTLSQGFQGGAANYTITVKQIFSTNKCINVTVDKNGNFTKGAAYTTGC